MESFGNQKRLDCLLSLIIIYFIFSFLLQTLRDLPSDLQDPDFSFPATTWEWDRAPPKDSLELIGTADTAKSGMLNIVEFTHWIIFPITFYYAHYVFVHADIIAKSPFINGDKTQVFLLLLSIICQAFGGVGPVVMHMLKYRSALAQFLFELIIYETSCRQVRLHRPTIK
jgi:hypothetical protein